MIPERNHPPVPASSTHEWFAQPREDARSREQPGLRFSCTMCGNCCSGPEGYVLVTDAEAQALADRLHISVEAFLTTYTHMTSQGRSLTEKLSAAGHDCVFLDREKVPGKAVCGVYEDRPRQCRTWPFWPSNLRNRAAWERAKRICPGMDQGAHYTPVQIRIARDAFKI